MPRFTVEVLQPTSVLDAAPDPRAAFEHVWALLPSDRLRRMWRFLESDGGLFIKGMSTTWRPAWTAFRLGRRLLYERRRLVPLTARGLPFPEVVAFGAERQRAVVTRSFLMLRMLGDVVDLEQFLLHGDVSAGSLEDKAARAMAAARAARARDPDVEPPPLSDADRERRRVVFQVVGRAVTRLHEAGAYHRDLSPRNVLLRFDGGGAPEVFFIDCPKAVLDPLPIVGRGLRRAELFRLVRGVRRTGATREECMTLLEEAAASEPQTILDYVDLQALSRRRPRRVSLWYVTGHAF